ncbi:uncharacterized protein LOC130753931 [Actinidia eriantha]|uniref:uncharacterized protein LOC130753931 n=1 Tax=Actinidia eriantha TaxID=165200 RepID=UPI002585F365|nr:uncharacterized protein LOC130753931 [Actinidia eriantha]
MEPSLPQRYRRDRRQLLSFIISSSRTIASLSDADLDYISADHVLDCVKSGGVLDTSKSTTKYHDESSYPIMTLKQQDLLLDMCPPSVEVNHTNSHDSCHPSCWNLWLTKISIWVKYTVTTETTSKSLQHAAIPTLGLPSMSTGLSDDDLRE